MDLTSLRTVNRLSTRRESMIARPPGPCAAGMELEARRAAQAAPTLFDELHEEEGDDAA
jgi:hypothetical protein